MLSELRRTYGLKEGLVTPYGLDDQIWMQRDSTEYDEEFCFLAERCISLGSNVYVRDRTTGKWAKIAKDTRAKTKLYSEWAGIHETPSGPLVIGRDVIDEYFQFAIVNFDNLICAPGAGPYCLFDGEKRLNVYVDDRIAGETDHVQHCEELLRIVRGALCGIDGEVGMDDMLAEIAAGRSVFAWVMQWLAVVYQRPGYTTQTNLWFVGPLRGIGKGSLIAVMRAILGANAVGKAVRSEVEKGWTNFMFGKLLVEWDEFRGMGWYDFADFIKEKTGNDLVSLTTRNEGAALQPAIGMNCFTTNNEKPLHVDRFDRQNTFVRTTDDERWKARANRLWDPQTNALVDARIATGFAALLNEIEIDYDFVRKQFATDLYKSLVGSFAPSWEQWVRGANIEVTLRSGQGTTIEAIHSAYVDWCKGHLHGKWEALADFRRETERAGLIELRWTRVNGKTARRYVVRVPDEEGV